MNVLTRGVQFILTKNLFTFKTIMYHPTQKIIGVNVEYGSHEHNKLVCSALIKSSGLSEWLTEEGPSTLFESSLEATES